MQSSFFFGILVLYSKGPDSAMRIMISPAKKMREDRDSFVCSDLPVFLDRAEVLKTAICALSYEQAKRMWGCSDRIAEENYERIRTMDLRKDLSPAILAYDGIQYQYMAPSVFENDEFCYVEQNLRILSGFYGILRPMDGVVPYRLEMQAKIQAEDFNDLYAFWGDRLYRELLDDSRVIVNLASAEYSRCVIPYLTSGDRCVTCIFGELEKGRVVQKGVYAKIARGEMVRYLAVNRCTEPEVMKGYNWRGYSFREELSDDDTYVFIRNHSKGEL